MYYSPSKVYASRREDFPPPTGYTTFQISEKSSATGSIAKKGIGIFSRIPPFKGS
jgi:hypothetical protein